MNMVAAGGSFIVHDLVYLSQRRNIHVLMGFWALEKYGSHVETHILFLSFLYIHVLGANLCRLQRLIANRLN
jgi:hypothetical protein